MPWLAHSLCFYALTAWVPPGPFIVPNVAHADQMSTLLLIELAMAAVPLTCALIHFPDLPVNPPNAAAAMYRQGGSADTAGFVSGLQYPLSVSTSLSVSVYRRHPGRQKRVSE